MRDSDFYAPGTYYLADAPWNEVEVPEKEFEVAVSQTLSKSTSIWTNQYQPEYDEETGHTDADTTYTDWKKAYKDVAMTPLEIIQNCGKIAKALLEEGKTRFAGIYLKDLVEECDDWQEDDYEVIEED